MILKLDPRWPLVWRTPTSVQIGVDPVRVRLDDVSEIEERMLSALVVGVGLPGLHMIGHGDATGLVARLEPVLIAEEAAPVARTVAICGTGAIVDELARAIASPTVWVVTGAEGSELVGHDPDIAVVIGHFVLAPSTHALWLRRDVPHLPIVFSDTGVTIGPLIEPGSGPCLLCLELHRRDGDEAWAAVATQLLGRSTGESATLVAEAAGAAARAITARLAGDVSRRSVRIDEESGDRTHHEWQPHPDCGCRELSADQQESDWVSAARRDPVPSSPTS